MGGFSISLAESYRQYETRLLVNSTNLLPLEQWQKERKEAFHTERHITRARTYRMKGTASIGGYAVYKTRERCSIVYVYFKHHQNIPLSARIEYECTNTQHTSNCTTTTTTNTDKNFVCLSSYRLLAYLCPWVLLRSSWVFDSIQQTIFAFYGNTFEAVLSSSPTRFSN